ncbi:Uncharacterized protein GBIM_01481 [Gryllus bimaculatus]|nr:Uncharacterized protein GBIM_01481 [Gryllus bimaculatus]
MNNSSIPDPVHVSFPWTESNRSVTLSSNRISVQENLSANKTSEMTGAASVTCVERKQRSASPILRIENSSNERLEKDVYHCEKEKLLTHNPDCAGDHEGSRRNQILHRSPEYRRYQEVRGRKLANVHESDADEVKTRHVFGALDVNRSLDDQTSDAVPESPVTARIPSPSSASSITSGRRLEWDSGADVGYYFEGNHNLHSGASLSTIERIALAHGRSSGLFERLDPEGICGPPKPVLGLHLLSDELDSPIAKSTPVYKSGSKRKEEKESAEKGSVVPLVEPPETVLPGGYLYLHSPEEFGNEMAPLPRNGSEGQNDDSTDEDKIPLSDNLNKKHSNSLVNLNCSCDEVPSSVPRSKSYLNLLDSDNVNVPAVERAVPPSRFLAGTCSVSSSSVATIVQRPIFPKTCDKFIQTLPLKLSVGVQVSENTDHSHFSEKKSELSYDAISSLPKEKDETKKEKQKISNVSNASQNHKCKGAHKKGALDYNHCQNYQFQSSNPSDNNNKTEKSSEEIHVTRKGSSLMKEFQSSEKGTLDSAASSSQTVESCVEETSCSGMEQPRRTHVGSSGVADSTNSFEYLPGHVFDRASKRPSDASKWSAASTTSANKVTLKSNALKEVNGRSDSRSSSLSKDIEEGVELLQKLMSEKSYNGKTKKKLIRLIVNKLVDTDYPEDHNDKRFQTDSLSCNVPWVPASQSSQHLKVLQACQYLHSEERKPNQNFYTPSSSESSKDRTDNSAMTEIQTSPSSCTPSGSVSVPGDNEQSQGETSEVSSNIFDSSRKHWKSPTSQTEEDYETNRAKFVKNSSPTPSLLHLCKSEHEKQLQWIRFEIDHLSQLKQLLEKQEGSKSHANLADHEHKFHKIKSANKNHSPSREFHRPKRSGNDDWSNSRLKDNSSQGNTSLQTCSSSTLSYQDPLPPHSCYHSKGLRGQSTPQAEERSMRKTDKRKDLSTQTLSLDSYILQNGSSNSGLKGINSDDGQLNVYVQTSPRALERQEKTFHKLPAVARISESARRSYESAVKCCCDCRKALEGLMKKDDRAQTYCRCESMSFESDHLVTDTSSSLRQTGTSTASHTPDGISLPQDAKFPPQKRDIATETVVNKTVQTTPSLNDIPIIRPIWSHEVSKDSSRKARDKFCPCCGLREKSFEPNERMHVQEKTKKKMEPKTPFVDEKGKHHTICDASVQTSNKEPLAYLLTFEPTCKENIRTQNKDMLPEIKLLVPVNQNRLENEMKRKASNLSTSKENQCPLKTGQPNEEKCSSSEKEEGKTTQKITLQDYLRANRPDYIQHADKRSQCLADLALLRDLRKQKRLELLAMTDQAQNENPKDVHSNERIVFSCASVPCKPKLTSRLIREQSRRKYHKTREVQNKFVEKKKKEDFKTNRLMAELFTKKLQKKVLKGVVNHSNSASIISSVP